VVLCGVVDSNCLLYCIAELLIEQERTKQKELEKKYDLLIAKEHTLQQSKRSRTPSGLHTPSTPGGTKTNKTEEGRSAGHYHDQLKLHFKAANDPNMYGITHTKFKLEIYRGRDAVYTCDSTGEDVRNLYIMMAVCDYEVENFLLKIENNYFNETNMDGKTTPPLFCPRSNVYVL
jgi:hypothetical protein